MKGHLQRIGVIQGVAPRFRSTPKLVDEARLGVTAISLAVMGTALVWFARPEGQRIIDSFLFLLRESPKANF